MTRPADTREQRRNDALRALLDELLHEVREVNRHSAEWTLEERARAEADLEAIMLRVRASAFDNPEG
ncbi:MAG TPA: hypothetical protein VFG84_07870 [Gemmatimonadaceae bacterium]|nr:hypothetical protein [Gemmatimonadaceae bacterium]